MRKKTKTIDEILKNLVNEIIDLDYLVEYENMKLGEFKKRKHKAINKGCSKIKAWAKSKVPSKEQIKNIGIGLVEKHFPKGKCKERGSTIVLYAELIILFLKVLDDIRKNLEGERDE